MLPERTGRIDGGMNEFIYVCLGGVIPAVVMLVVYFIALAGRFAKIETNIKWLKRVMEECLPHLRNHSR